MSKGNQDSYTGDQIFDGLTRSKAPEQRIKKLDDDAIRRLMDTLDQLPRCMCPALIRAMADSEAVSRFRQCNHPK